MKLFFIILISIQTAFAFDINDIKSNLEYNYNYLVESQVKCDGSFEKGNYICNKEEAGERRILGTWDSYIVPVVVDSGFPVKYVDSNMFVTAHTVFPMFFLKFEDPQKEKKRMDVVYNAMTAVNLFKRNGSFAFWPQIGASREGQVDRIGPLNLSPLLLTTQLKIVDKIQSFFHVKLFPEKVRWMEEHLDLDNEDLGMDAMFSVPNDADDTALGIASNYYYYQDLEDKGALEEYLDMTSVFASKVDEFSSRKNRRYKEYLPNCKERYDSLASQKAKEELFNDINFLKECSLDDPRESWRYTSYDSKHSGAYLTWLYDETKDIYDNPEQGVALPGQNSVDCNVVSNVIYSLSLTEKRKDPALRESYINSCNSLTNTIIGDDNQLKMTPSPREIDSGDMSVWKYCGLFYPAHMTFPYLISKAVSEASACQDLDDADQKRFDIAMKTLYKDIADEQDEELVNKVKGEWFEKIDDTYALPTVLGATSIVNFYKHYGDELGESSEAIQARVDSAIEILFERNEYKTINGVKTASLAEGTFFGGGTVNEIAHWRSKPFATSVSLELMSKYLINFGDAKMDGKKLIIPSRSHNKKNQMVQEKVIETRDLDIDYKQDSLAKLKETSVDSSFFTSARHDLETGSEVIVGVELSFGEHLEGNVQEKTEKVAFYKVKLNSEFGLNSSSVVNYSLSAKFLGVSTKTDFIIEDEIAFLPITYISERDIQTRSAHLLYGKLGAPIMKLSENGRINIDIVGKILGTVQKSVNNGDLNNQQSSYDLADFTVGLTYKNRGFSAGISYQTAIGYSNDSNGGDYSSHNNYKVGLKLDYDFNKNNRITLKLESRHNGDKKDLFSDDQIRIEYQYKFK
jgi:hypothetical protein